MQLSPIRPPASAASTTSDAWRRPLLAAAAAPVLKLPSTLGSHSLMRQLGYDYVASLCRHGRNASYGKGQDMIRQGHPPGAFFILLSGSAQLRRTGPDDKVVVLGRLQAGDHFGEVSLIDGRHQVASVRCTSSCQTLELSGSQFAHLMSGDTRFAMAILSALVNRVRAARRKVVNLALLEVPDRIVRCLHELAEPCDDGFLVATPPSHNELSMLIGAARSSVTRALRQLELDGHVAIESRGILLRTHPDDYFRHPAPLAA